VIGRIDFQAPDETTGTDAILVAAGIAAVSEGDFSSSNNATKLSFRTAASETASEKMSLSSGGNLTISGDLTVSGDDITMGTNTSGHIMVADGTNFNPVAVSGDIGISNTGAVSISTGVIVNADISATAAIDPDKFDLTAAADGTGITIAAGDLFLVADADDSNTVKKVNASQINTYTSAESSAIAADNITTGDGAVSLETSSGNVLVDSQAGTATLDGHTGVTIQSSNSGDITLDSVADINLDAGGADIVLKDDGTTFGSITNSGGEVVIKSGSTPTTALTFAGDDANFADNVQLDSDAAELLFGDDGEVKLIHNADAGLLLKHTATGDGTPISLTLQTGETALTVGEPLGTINFQAPDEAGGTDAILIAAAIEAVAEGTFAADNNATKLSFKTGASEAASEKMSLSSAGLLTVADDIMIKDGGTIGVASTNDALTISSAGLLTVKDDLVIKSGGTIGGAGDTDLLELGSAILTVNGEVSMTTLDIGGTNVGSTAAELNLLDGSAKSTSSITVADSDAIIIIDGTTTKQIPASDIKTYAGGASVGDATALAVALG